ncbi:MAG: Rieske 2Fe-2S domain-containing protein [Microthrixaceae bacterium]|nr:Rieske 2Fe-2S domain-containing protein [Microthrixaceae bacterium]
MTPLAIVAIVIIVVAAIALVAAASRRKDLGSATGQLSRETLKRDRARRLDDSELISVGVTGKEIERAASADRGEVAVPVASTAPTVWVAPDEETLGVTRRQFLNRSIVVLMGLGIALFATVSFPVFLWPFRTGGFGSKLRMGKITDLVGEIQTEGGFLYRPEGRMWLVEYPKSAIPKGQVVYGSQPSWPGMEAGILALYQKCVHLGCRVPSCDTSKWFECACHGSQYNQVGERKGGPAPRGLDRFAMEVSADGVLTVNTGMIVQGPPLGTNTTGQEAQGPHCI